MLKTRNVFIDTQTFVAGNFFQNKNLKRLTEYSAGRTINLYLTEITKAEIQSNIKEEIHLAAQEIEKFKKAIAGKGKILKQFEAFKPYFELPRFDLQLNFEKVADDLEHFIRDGKVQFIPFESADIKSIVEKYFRNDPPFNKGNKKYEFPDAIVLSAIEQWCATKQERMYVVSGDPDFLHYNSAALMPIGSLKTLLGLILRQYHADETAWISKIFELKQEVIKNKLEAAFSYKIKDELGFDIDIKKVEVTDIELFDYTIVEQNTGGDGYVFQFDYDVTFTVEVIYNDYSMSSYDKEDDKWYFPQKARRKVELTTTQTAEVTIEAYFDEGESPETAFSDITNVSTSIPSSDKITNELDGYMDEL